MASSALVHPSQVDSSTSTLTHRNDIATSPRLYLKGIHLLPPMDSNTEHASQSGESNASANAGRKLLFQQAVKDLFSVHGQVVAVFVRDIHADYAFVAMATTEQAQQVLSSTETPHALFEEIHPAADLTSKNDKKDQQPLTKMESQQLQSIQTLRDLGQSANLLVQCNKSHMERVQDVLSNYPGLEVQGSTNYKIVSLIFCHCPSPRGVVRWLDSTWYIQPIIQRVFVGHPTSMPATSQSENDNQIQNDMQNDLQLPMLCQCIDVPDAAMIEKAMGILGDMTHHQRIRLTTYPPILQKQLAPILKNTSIPWNPQSPTHILNVVQLVPPTWQQEGLYWMGVADSSDCITSRDSSTSSSATPTTPLVDSCSRAYFKLQEALERYFGTSIISDRPHWPSAIDVGASPGGWTQFLLEQCHCHHVYSIDPGKIDARVWDSCSLNGTTAMEQQQPKTIDHIAMKYQDGLPEVARRRSMGHANDLCQAVDCYVSDMCVKTMSEQIDALLLAVSLGLVQPNQTFVILTIKCTRGHSKATFDTLVTKQVERIQNHIHQLQILHLFANRYSERTVMGYWK